MPCLRRPRLLLLHRTSNNAKTTEANSTDEELGNIDDEEEATDVPTSEDEVVAAALPQLHDYVVARRIRSKVRTLHLVGACWRQPGVHYVVGELFGTVLPDPSKYNPVCKNCFKRPEAVNSIFSGVDSPTTGSSGSDSG